MARKNFRNFLSTHYQLIGVLVASFIVLTSTGTYTNWDSQLEFQAASSVVSQGFPFVANGLMINQPPLGFYMDAPVFKMLGLSYLNGVGIMTAFALGSIVLVYALGCLLYGRGTGLVAAVLLGIVPWQVYMSKMFLIDVQMVFLSLLVLIIGIVAVRRNSEKILLASGIVFSLALLTKLFAVLILVPLLIIIFFNGKSSGFKLTLRKVLVFLAPSFILQTVWFGGLANQNFFGVYFSSDFTHPVHIADPNLLFLPKLLTESAGWFIFLAGLFSLTLTVVFWKIFKKTFWMDIVCLGAIATVAALDLALVFGFHLFVPYVSAFKYNYLALPFFSLLAASLANKSTLLFNSIEPKRLIQKLKLVPIGFGFILIFASMIESLNFLNAWIAYATFEVDSNGHYYLINAFSSPMAAYQQWRYAAIAIAILSLIFPFIIKGFRRGFNRLTKDPVKLSAA